MAAGALIVDQLTGVFHAVRAAQHGGQGQADDRAGVGIAGQGGGVDRLTSAVSAAVGGQEHINGGRGFAAFDTPVGQVKFGVGQRQKAQIRDTVARHDHGWGGGTGAARQAKVKAGIALIIGGDAAKNLVRGAKKVNGNAGLGGGCGQGTDENMQAIHARQRGQPQIGQGKPLPSRGRQIGIGPRHLRAQDIESCRLTGHGVIHRQAGGDVAVDVQRYLGRAGPQFRADLRGEIIFLIVLHRRAEIAVLQGAQQVAVGHLEQRQGQRIGIDGFHRQIGPAQSGQHITAPRKAHRRRAVADIGGQRDRLGQSLAIGGGQTFAQSQGIALAMFDPCHAQLAVAIRRYGQAGIRKLNKSGIIHAGRHKIFGEGHANARTGGIGLHVVRFNPEPVFADGVVQCQCGVVARLQALRQTQRLHLVAAPAHRLSCVAKGDQDAVLKPRIIGAQIGVHRTLKGEVLEIAGIVGIGACSQQDQPRKLCPVSGRVGQVDGGTGKAERGVDIAVRFSLAGRGHVFLGSPAVCDIGIGQIAGLHHRAVQIPGRQEGQVGPARLRKRFSPRRGCQHKARPSGDKAFTRAGIGFGKAGIGLGVEGKGGAGHVGQAGAFASVQGGVENRGQITAGQVDILRNHQTPFRDQRAVLRQNGGRSTQKRKNRSNRPGKTTHVRAPEKMG